MCLVMQATSRLSQMQCGVGCSGEVLGCTAPVVPAGTDAIVFVADGRFHLEAIMIANPDIAAFKCALHSPARSNSHSLSNPTPTAEALSRCQALSWRTVLSCSGIRHL